MASALSAYCSGTILLLVATSAVVASGASAMGSTGVDGTRCRCTPSQPCWSAVPWAELNASVHGRLVRYEDPMSACISDEHSVACVAALNAALGSPTNDSHWLEGHPEGLQHTGYFAAWNITSDHPEYVVPAQTEDDVVAAVAFASRFDLRLVVKNTGHDWYGRSTAAGSLMISTHFRKKMVWHDDFVPEGCPAGTPGVPAVTIESGVQFSDLYPVAQERGRLVIGGTCDSVGAAGCWLSGCYGVFSKLFGAGAINMLSARVVLANGTVVIASKCSNPDLFWSLRGGGGGNTGVITEFTARSHPSPRWTTMAAFNGNVTSRAEYDALVAQVINRLSVVSLNATQSSDGGMGFGTAVETLPNGTSRIVYLANLMIQGYESDVDAQVATLSPLLEFTRTGVKTGRGSIVTSRWDEKDFDPKVKALPWYGDSAGDKSTLAISMMTRFLPQHYIATHEGSTALASAFARVTDTLPIGETVGVMIPKAQAGISAELRAEFDQTALNPVILDTAGTLLQMRQVPWFDEVAPSSTVLAATWPRLQASLAAFIAPEELPRLDATCIAGVGGDEAAAVSCLNEFQASFPAYQRRVDRVREILTEAMPNVDSSGKPFSGAYWSETDYFEEDYQMSYWGAEKYPKLLAIKAKYDPDGLFICHLCVGAEFWTKESNLNCRNTSRQYPVQA